MCSYASPPSWPTPHWKDSLPSTQIWNRWPNYIGLASDNQGCINISSNLISQKLKEVSEGNQIYSCLDTLENQLKSQLIYNVKLQISKMYKIWPLSWTGTSQCNYSVKTSFWVPKHSIIQKSFCNCRTYFFFF